MRLFIIVLLSLCSTLTFAQQSTLWGSTFAGGDADAGYVFKMGLGGSDFEIVHELDGAEGGKHFGAGFVQASDGLLYGMTAQGGDFNRGVLMSIDPGTNELRIRHHFEITSGFTSRLTEAANGKLYGYGTEGVGRIFEFDPANDQLTIVHEFERPAGAAPLPEDFLIEVAPNVLFGATPSGGDNNDGVLFELDLETSAYAVKFHFDENTTGKGPRPGLLLASDGLIYGVCNRGGSLRRGTIFTYNRQTEAFNVAFDLTVEQVNPNGGLIEASNGKIYGTATLGGVENHGALFEFDPGTGQLTTRISFREGAGNIAEAPVMQASNGLIYGMTRYGGSGQGFGMVYTYNPENQEVNTAASLNDGFPLDNVLVEVIEPVVTSLEAPENPTFSFYPNPAQNELHIKWQGVQRPLHIEVMAVGTGNSVRLESNEDRINLSPLAPGLYFFKVVQADGSYHIQKILKQ